jgi:MFS family permease
MSSGEPVNSSGVDGGNPWCYSGCLVFDVDTANKARSMKDKAVLRYLVVANFFLFFGYRIWQATFNNFAVEELGVGPANMGLIQAVREIPGLTGFVVGVAVLLFSEIRIMAFSIVLLGLGIFLTGRAGDVPFLLMSTVVMSMGFHFFYPSNNAVLLMAVDKERAPERIGQLRSLGAVAAVAATAVVYLLAGRLGFRGLLGYTGGALVGAGCLLFIYGGPRDGLPGRRKVILRKRYWLFYTLAFFMGCRRHIFTTFAIFLLVREHGISVETTATLFLVNSLVNVYMMQLVGRLVGRFGERIMLSIAFGILCLVFLGYAYVHYLPVLYALFVVDNVVFGFNLALTTYFQKIAVSKEEITSNLSVQMTINHVAAIIVPVGGGVIWELFGAEAPFLGGFGVVVVSLLLTQFMRTPSETR